MTRPAKDPLAVETDQSPWIVLECMLATGIIAAAAILPSIRDPSRHVVGAMFAVVVIAANATAGGSPSPPGIGEEQLAMPQWGYASLSIMTCLSAFGNGSETNLLTDWATVRTLALATAGCLLATSLMRLRRRPA